MKNLRNFICLFLITISLHGIGQSMRTSWIKVNSSTFDGYTSEIAKDGAGAVYSSGWFSGTTTFGSSSLTSNGGKDFFVMKQNDNGDVIWAKKFGGVGNDELLYDLVTDHSGNSYIIGAFSGSMMIGSTNYGSTGGTDAFLIKVDSAGSFVWVKILGSTSDDQGTSVRIDNLGDIVISGFFRGTVNFSGINLTSTGSSDIFVCKYSPAGVISWAKKFGSTGYDQNYALGVDGNGYIYLSGNTAGNFTFGSATANGSYFVKMAPNGNSIWAKSVASSSYNPYEIQIGTDNNAYMIGWFTNTVNFMNSITLNSSSSNDQDFFIAKIDSSGAPLWAYVGNSPGTQYALALGLDSLNNVYVSGFTSDTLNYRGNRKTTNGGTDAYALKVNSSGDYVWSAIYGGPLNDESHGVFADRNGQLYLSGCYRQNISFDGILVNGGANSTAFLSKIGVLSAEPTVASSGLSFQNIGIDSMLVKINKGNGSARLVLAKQAGAVSVFPVDRMLYSSNNQFGAGGNLGNNNFAVYFGADTVFLLKGLTPNTMYSFAVFESNGVSDSINYLTTSYATGSQLTLPIAPIFAGANSCYGDSVSLTTDIISGLTYEWIKDNNSIPNSNSNLYYAKQSGNYKVRVSNSAGTSESAIKSVVIYSLPTSIISNSGALTFCQGGNVTLQANDSIGFSYSWFLDGSPISGAVAKNYAASASGLYKVKVTDANGCSNISSNATVTVNALPAKPVISYTSGVLSSSSAIGYQWYLNNAAISGAVNQMLTPIQSGVYEVEVSDMNTCKSKSDTTNIIIQANSIKDIFSSTVNVFPNPNNGHFKVMFESAGLVNGKIIDQLGRVIYQWAETNNIVNYSKEIDIYNASFGVYFMIIDSEKGTTFTKISLGQ